MRLSLERMLEIAEDCEIEIIDKPGEHIISRLDGVEVNWDAPTNEAKDDAEMYCGNCDYHLTEDWNYCPDCGVKLLIHGRDIY